MRKLPSSNCPSFQARGSFERTDVAALNGGLGGTETQTDILVPSSATLARSGRLGLSLGVEKDVRLLLESALGLDCQLGRPVQRNITGQHWNILTVYTLSVDLDSLFGIALGNGEALHLE